MDDIQNSELWSKDSSQHDLANNTVAQIVAKTGGICFKLAFGAFSLFLLVPSYLICGLFRSGADIEAIDTTVDEAEYTDFPENPQNYAEAPDPTWWERYYG